MSDQRRSDQRFELLTEGAFSESRKPTADRPIVENVKLLGLKSKNGRVYLKEAIRAALPLYERAVSYFDHSDKPRLFIERFGRFVNQRFIEGDGVRADFKFNPKHPHAETFLWWLENDPDGIGFSHAAEGRIERINGIDTVTEIRSIASVDLVCGPATTRGIHESTNPAMPPPNPSPAIPAVPGAAPDPAAQAASYKSKLGELITAILNDPALDEAAIREKVCGALDMVLGKGDVPEQGMGDEEDEDKTPEQEEEDDMKKGDDKKAAKPFDKADEQAMKNPKVKAMMVELDGFKAAQRLAEQTAKAKEACIKHGLPPALVTEVFVSSLVEARDDGTRLKLIEDRKALAPKQSPQSLPSGIQANNLNADAPTLDGFLKTIYGGK